MIEHTWTYSVLPAKVRHSGRVVPVIGEHLLTLALLEQLQQ